MLDLARTGRTSDPLLIDLNIARAINRYALTAIGWWEVGRFDETTLDYFMALNAQLPAMQSGIAKIEGAKAKIREQFKSRR